MEHRSSTVVTTKPSVIRFMPTGFTPVVADLRPSVLSGIDFGVTLSYATLRVVGITTRSVVQRSLPTQDYLLPTR